jgi:hypothetical protein
MSMLEEMNKSLGGSKSGSSSSKEPQYAMFEIVTRIDAESTKFVDIGYLQSLPEYAVF